MIDPWFDPVKYSYLPGTLLGVTVGLWGGMMGCFNGFRKAFPWLFYSGCLFLAASIALLVLGIVAVATGQPYGIWYALLLPGMQGTILLPIFLWMLRSRRQQNELNAMMAEDVREASK